MEWIAEKGRLITFDRVAHKLKHPADGKQCQRPSPPEEEQRPRDRNHRDADCVAEFVQRVPMLRFVVIDKRVSHDQEFPRHQ